MYTTYFGLKENPFSNASDPRYFFMSDVHREAFSHLLYGISSDDSFILLTGDVGTGKTTICRHLLSKLPGNADVVFVANPRITALELFKKICAQLAIPLQEGEATVQFCLDELRRYLLDTHSLGRNTSLLIDEAQGMNFDFLEQLRLLANLEQGAKKLLKIVLLGQPELKQVLEKNGSDQVSQRITSHYHLLALDKEDVFSYVRYRLAIAGGKGKFFTDAALSRIFHLSQGVPLLVNRFCDRAMVEACKEEKYLVGEKIVEKTARDEQGQGRGREEIPKDRQLVRPVVLLVLLLVFGVGMLTFYLSGRMSLQSGSSHVPEASVLVPPPSPAMKGTAKVEDEAGTTVDPGLVEERPRAGRIRIVPLEVSE